MASVPSVSVFRRGLSAFTALTALGGILALATVAQADLVDGRYDRSRVFDVQRSPASPIAGQNLTLSSMSAPFRDNGMPYELLPGEYVQFFYVGGSCTDGKVGIRRYEADGDLIEEVSAGGSVWGLEGEGFLYISDSGDYGTFVANEDRFAYGDDFSYVTSSAGATGCSLLADYDANVTVDAEVVCPPARGTCTASTKALIGVKAGSDPAKWSFKWKWSGGEVETAELGTPTDSANQYALCIYDGDDALWLQGRFYGGGTCGKKSCWKAKSTGAKYKRKVATVDGVTKAGAKYGPAGSLSVAGKGSSIDVGPLPITAMGLGVAVQLHRVGEPTCWGATYPTLKKSSDTGFSAK